MCYNESYGENNNPGFCFHIFHIFTTFPHNASADFDCENDLKSTSARAKQFCQSQLDQLNQQLIELNAQLNNQKNKQDPEGDVDYLTSQINALKRKSKLERS